MAAKPKAKFCGQSLNQRCGRLSGRTNAILVLWVFEAAEPKLPCSKGLRHEIMKDK